MVVDRPPELALEGFVLLKRFQGHRAATLIRLAVALGLESLGIDDAILGVINALTEHQELGRVVHCEYADG